MTTLIPSYYTLRFADRAEAEAVCRSLGYWDDTINGPIADGMIDGPDGIRGFSIVEIGLNPKPPGKAALSGYYCNVAGKLPDAVAPYQVPYGSAGVVFAGAEPAPGAVAACQPLEGSAQVDLADASLDVLKASN